jgi:poly-gamma-glutamate capsule biosynthesis protein CapA/YwtB (metallophosphatase superfamily)
MRSTGLALACAIGVIVAAMAGCDAGEEQPSAATAPPAAEPAPEKPRETPPTQPEEATPAKSEIVLLAGGDVSFGRMRGQRLLREPERDDFAALRHLFDPADVRFVNLECTISDQNGETQSPIMKLVFTAPPGTERALRRAGIDIVSLANNHAWDYGQRALFETFDRLEAAKVQYVGAGRTRERAYAPEIVEVGGRKLAFVAVTAIWNQELFPHPGREHVADAQEEALVESVRAARAIEGVDWVIVSHHGGYEYVDQPHEGTRRLLTAAIEAGADAVIGHHPHVVQRIASHAGRPVLYSLGNLLMRMKSGEPWTEYGMLARLRLGKSIGLSICPYRIFGLEPVPLGRDPHRASYEGMFRNRFEALLRQGALIDPATAVELGAFDEEGCAEVTSATRAASLP